MLSFNILSTRFLAYYKIVSRVSRVSRVILLTLLHLKISKNITKPSKNGPKRFKTAQNYPKQPLAKA